MDDASFQSQALEICTDVFQSTFATRKLAEKAAESVKKAEDLRNRYIFIENELRGAHDRLETIEATLRQRPPHRTPHVVHAKSDCLTEPPPANLEPTKSNRELINNLELELCRIDSKIEDLSRSHAAMLDMRALITECNAELREYDVILAEWTETVQESMVPLFVLVWLAYSKSLTWRSKLDVRQRNRRPCKRRKPFQAQLDLHTVLGALYAFMLFWLPLDRSPTAAFFGASVRLLLLISFKYMYLNN